MEDCIIKGRQRLNSFLASNFHIVSTHQSPQQKEPQSLMRMVLKKQRIEFGMQLQSLWHFHRKTDLHFSSPKMRPLHMIEYDQFNFSVTNSVSNFPPRIFQELNEQLYSETHGVCRFINTGAGGKKVGFFKTKAVFAVRIPTTSIWYLNESWTLLDTSLVGNLSVLSLHVSPQLMLGTNPG